MKKLELFQRATLDLFVERAWTGNENSFEKLEDYITRLKDYDLSEYQEVYSKCQDAYIMKKESVNTRKI